MKCINLIQLYNNTFLVELKTVTGRRNGIQTAHAQYDNSQ